MKTVLAFAALLAIAYGTPIEIYTGPTNAPYPELAADQCPSCEGKENGNYPIVENDDESDKRHKYYLTCDNGIAKCRLCDPKGELVYNKNCDECRIPEDRKATQCQRYTGPTGKPQYVCGDEDKKYAVNFCQNLKDYPDGLADFDGKSGDFAYVVYGRNQQNGEFERQGSRKNFYISCVEGMYGWCRPCPNGLEWSPLLDKETGKAKKDCGRCDYPPTTAAPTTAP